VRTRTSWKIVALASAALFTTLAVAAPGDPPASEASIRQLLEVTQSRQLLDDLSAQLDQMMRTSMQQALAGKQFSVEQQKILDDMRTKLVKIFGEHLQWDQLEPMYLDIYKKSFTQNEVDGMLAFYKTEAGKALIAKMPLAMQNTMQATQSKMAALMPQVQQLQRETVERLKATERE
jgi:uncharacterized protein